MRTAPLAAPLMTRPARPPSPQASGALGIRSPRVKAARQLGKKAFRERGRSFLAEGPQAVREALRQPGVLTELFVTGQGRGRHPELVDAGRQPGRRRCTR